MGAFLETSGRIWSRGHRLYGCTPHMMEAGPGPVSANMLLEASAADIGSTCERYACASRR